MNDWDIYVAKIGKTVGLKGQLRLIIDTDFPEQFKKDKILKTSKDTFLKIENLNTKNNTVKFEDCNSIEEASRLVNLSLFVSSDDTKDNCALKEKQFFWFDIENCTIIEDNEILGVIESIQRYPIDDYLLIRTSNELVESGLAEIFLIPYSDNYIVKTNIESKTIEVKNSKHILEAS